jgi:hypothetical protein
MISFHQQERGLFRLRRLANVARCGIFAAFLALFSACANTEPMFVNLIRDPSASGPADEHATKRSCSIVIAAVNDDRSNRETLGVAAGGRPIIAHSVAEWVARGLRDLGSAGYSVQSSGQEAVRSGSDLVIEVGIRRVYARAFSTQFEAVVALKVKFSGRGGPMEGNYRGSVTRLNWVNGNVEFAVALNEALVAAVRRIGEDIERIC